MASYSYDSDFEMGENTGNLNMSLNDYQEEQEEQYLQQEESTSSILDSETTSSPANTDTKKLRSWVWTHFTYDKNIKKAQCNICKTYIITNKGSTSGLSRHLKNMHLLIIQKNKNQLTLQETLQNIPIPVSYI
jgi:BED zinc finger